MQSTQQEVVFRLPFELASGPFAFFNSAEFQSMAANTWLWIIVIGYILSAIGLFILIYAIIRLFELRKREEQYYGKVLISPETIGDINPRWTHILSLADGESASQWREAIIEADIMLDDMLTRQGYVGDGVGEKLKAVEPSDFNTLQDAWEAHKVRNQIAHEGSSFNLSEELARRTISRFEAVFREFNAI
jgi:hypothetical protein